MKQTMAFLALLALLATPGCRRAAPPAQTDAPPADLPTGVEEPGKTVTVAMIPKLKGIPYFNACQRGAEEAAKELGITLEFDGPTEARVDKQVEMIDACIARGVSVIAISANDPVAVAPALKRARERGIHVITWDADADASASGREFFVNQATPKAIGSTLVDVMAAEAGADAPVAILTSSLTAPNQNEWIKHMKAQMGAKYPKMKLVDTRPSEEDQQLALTRAQDILKAHPEVKGIWGISSVAFPGAAEAVKQAGKSRKVAVVGLSTPKDMAPYVKGGTVKTVVLWNPLDLGYLTVQVAHALANGSLAPGQTTVKAGRLKECRIADGQVLLGPPMQFTRENIEQFDF